MKTFAALLVIAALVLAGLASPASRRRRGRPGACMAATTPTLATATLNQDQRHERSADSKSPGRCSSGSLRSQESTPILVGDLPLRDVVARPKERVRRRRARRVRSSGAIRPRSRRASSNTPAATSTIAESPTPTAGFSWGGSTGIWSRWMRRPERSCGRARSSTSPRRLGHHLAAFVKNLVITGFGGGEYGVRGLITAFDQETGQEVWRLWTVPGPGEPGNDTWKVTRGSSGAAWLAHRLIRSGARICSTTGRASLAMGRTIRGTDSGNFGPYSNLYSASTLAINPGHRQDRVALPDHAGRRVGLRRRQRARAGRPQRQWPEDAGDAQGRPKRFLLCPGPSATASSCRPRNSSTINWAKSIDMTTGRPVEKRRQATALGLQGEGHLPESHRREKLGCR